MTHARASLALLLALGSHAPALASDATPPRRAHHALVYDAARRAVLLTAGSTPLEQGKRFVFYDDLWAFDSCGWRPLGQSGSEVSGVSLAADPKRGRLLSFGGYNGRSLGELRALEGNAWKPLGVLDEMPVAEPGFVFDAARNRFVAFGGSPGPGQVSEETWEYDGAKWTRAAGTGPPGRQAHVMAYDARRARTVVFGGLAGGPRGQRPPVLGDTWEYDGKRWREIAGPGPSPRNSPGVAYDSKRGLVILFGGAGDAGFLGDTWGFDGKAWTKLADTGPEPRAMGSLAYDPQRDRVVLFGGRKGWPDGDLDDTWEWDGKRWAQATPVDCGPK